MRRRSEFLPEIECITKLEDLEAAYAQRFGAAPFNISHWDPSEEFHREMLQHLEMPALSSAINYRFSYQIEQTKPVLSKLGGCEAHHELLFTPSSTSSILCALNWLRSLGIRRMLVACPAYFSVFHASRRFGIELGKIYLRRTNGEFSLPNPRSRTWRKPAALWLTSPVYGAGVYLSPDAIAFVSRLLESGWSVIADECLALPGNELIRTLGRHANFMSIYSPHKSVCVNGVKVSALIYDAKHGRLLDQWADVWYGGLGCSSSAAIAHFLSGNFDSYLSAFLKAIEEQHRRFQLTCEAEGVEIDLSAKGHFVSCYFPALPSGLGNSARFMERLIYATGGSLISGNRSRLHGTIGFSFRVNLARSGALFDPTLARIVRYLANCIRSLNK